MSLRLGKLPLIFIAVSLIFIPASATYASEVKVVAKKTAKPIPSPKPKWPPSGFKGKDGVYAKIPSSKELIGLLSARRALQSTVKKCEEFACGAVIAAAETGCVWWEVTSAVYRFSGEDNIRQKIGELTTFAKGSEKRAQTTIFLISGQIVAPEVSVGNIKVICHRNANDKPKPGNIYEAIPSASPSSSTEGN